MKPIPSCPGYFAGEDGHIYSKGKRRVSRDNGHGYLALIISFKDSKVRCMYVHRLVCEAYHGPCPPGFHCRHLDGTRANNVPANLQWSDKMTNELDKIKHGTLARGETSGSSILTDALVMQIRERATKGEALAAIAKDLGFGRAVVGGAACGRTWKHLPGAIAPRSTCHRDPSTGKWVAGAASKAFMRKIA